jgi:hypothetical protein
LATIAVYLFADKLPAFVGWSAWHAREATRANENKMQGMHIVRISQDGMKRTILCLGGAEDATGTSSSLLTHSSSR